MPETYQNRLILWPSGQASSQATGPTNPWASLLVTARAGSSWVETSTTLPQNDKLVALHTALAATTELFTSFLLGPQLLPHQEDCCSTKAAGDNKTLEEELWIPAYKGIVAHEAVLRTRHVQA